MELVFVLFASSVMAKEIPQYTARNWQTDDGLPHNTVSTVVQTHDGYLWVGTPQGLARFDGTQFNIFHPRNTPELEGQTIRYLYQTRDGRLWMATERNGLTSYKD